MTEPDVTLTDYALMLLCMTFIRMLVARTFVVPVIRRVWILFFSSLALASFTGGTVHGFFLDETSAGYQILWPLTLLAVGITAASAWMLAGLLMFGLRAQKYLVIFSGISFLAYSVVVLTYSQSFAVVIINYIPPMTLLLLAAGFNYKKNLAPPFRTDNVVDA